MTIEQLVDMSLEQLEAMTPEQMEEFFEPYLKVTRPERVVHTAKQRSVAGAKAHKVTSVEDEARKMIEAFRNSIYAQPTTNTKQTNK